MHQSEVDITTYVCGHFTNRILQIGPMNNCTVATFLSSGHYFTVESRNGVLVYIFNCYNLLVN